MADERSRLTLDVLARVRGTQDVTRLSRAMDDVGDEMSGAARDAKTLDKAIDGVTGEIRELNRELLRTGDVNVDAKLKVSRSTLSTLRRMRRELGEVDDQAQRAGSSIMETLAALPAQAKGALLVAAGAVSTAAAPVIAAAVLGGVGAGGLVGGIVAASRSQRVRSAAEELVDRFQAPTARIGAIFADPVIGALDELGDAGTDVLRDLTPELRALAPLVTDLAVGIGDAVRAAAPGIREALNAARPVLRALSGELPELGDAISDMLVMVSRNSDSAVEGLRAISELAQLAARSVGVLTNIPLPPLGDFLLGLIGSDSRTELKDLSATEDELAESTLRFSHATIEASGSMREAARIAGDLNAALMELNGGALDVRSAENQFQAAIDEANASVEEYGRTLDVTTEAGRSNRAALDAIATSSQSLASAIFDQTGSQEQATEAIRNGRRALIDAAVEMGLGEQAARDLANEILGIPDRWRSDGSTNADRLRGDIEDFIRAVDNIPDGRTVTITTRHVNQFITQTFGPNASQAQQTGGSVVGPYGVDKVPTMLTAGEFVVRKSQAEKHSELLRAINAGTLGGAVQPISMSSVRPGAAAPMAMGRPANVLVSASGSSDRLLNEIIRALSFRVRTDAGGDPNVFFGGS